MAKRRRRDDPSLLALHPTTLAFQSEASSDVLAPMTARTAEPHAIAADSSDVDTKRRKMGGNRGPRPEKLDSPPVRHAGMADKVATIKPETPAVAAVNIHNVDDVPPASAPTHQRPRSASTSLIEGTRGIVSAAMNNLLRNIVALHRELVSGGPQGDAESATVGLPLE